MSESWIDQVVERNKSFESDHSSALADFNRNYRMYRGIPTRRRAENQSNTHIPEMLVEVEALATAVHEMVFSDQSGAKFFDVVGEGPEDIPRALVTKGVISKQLEVNEFETKTLPFFRMLILQGSYPVDIPWSLEYKSYWDKGARVRKPAFDSWDFEPFNILNFAFDDTVSDIEKGTWTQRVQDVNAMVARKMARAGVWEESAVKAALEEGMKRSTYWDQQRKDAGYLDSSKAAGMSVIHDWGVLDGPDYEPGEVYWSVCTRDGKPLKAPEINPYDHGENPFLMGKWIALPDEPYAMGVGHVNAKQQTEINDRRNFINDLLMASLYCMWLKRSDAGFNLPGGVMRFNPLKIIEADGVSEEFFRALRPDLAGLVPAMNLESADRETMRRNSGATSSLQAIATGITATESQSIQSEATRRVKAMVRAQVATLLKKFLYRVHALNTQFLDLPIVARITNEDGSSVYGEVSREDLLLQPDIRMKITTDLDFRPFKRRELLEMLQIFSQLEKNYPTRKFTPEPIIEELAATYGMNPRRFLTREGALEMETRRATMTPQVQQRALQEVMSESPAAQEVLAGAGV